LPGFVRVYERAYGSTKFEQVGYDITNGMAKEEFGKSVDLSDDGSELIVGIPDPGPRWGNNYGYANYYRRDNSLNFYEHQGENDLYENRDFIFGFEVAFGGGDIFGLGFDAILQRNDTNYWITEMIKDKYPYGDDDDDDTSNIWCKYRGSRALSGDGSVLALICYEHGREDIYNENRTAYVSIYDRNNNVWTLTSKISPDSKEVYGDHFSSDPSPALALSGDGSTLAWGSPAINRTSAGYISGPVRVYERDSSNNYNQVGSDIVGETKSDFFGFKVDLSNNGAILAVTAPENDGDVGCEMKFRSSCYGGHVRIYERDSSNNWVQVGSDINGKKKDEHSGESIALSNDGSIVAIGSPYKHNLVRVYELQCDHPPSPFMIWLRKNGEIFWSLIGLVLVLMLISLVAFFRFKKERKKDIDSSENDSRPQETFVGDVTGVEEAVI